MIEERRVADTQWHLDKKVPVALILAILFQTGVALWWAAAISGRVEQLEKTTLSRSNIPDRVTRLEVILEQLPKTLDRIEQKLDQKLDKK